MMKFLKRIRIIRIITDIIIYPIIAYMIAVLTCCAMQNGWWPDVWKSTKITYDIFQRVYHIYIILIPVYMFVRGIHGVYTKPFKEKYEIPTLEKAKEKSENDKKQMDLKAIHEAGHYVMAELLGYKIEEAVILSDAGKIGGFVKYNNNPIMNTKELKDRVLVLYSGLCAERLILGDASTGCMGDEQADLPQAYNCLKAYVVLTNNDISLALTEHEVDQLEKEIAQLSKLWEQEAMDLLKDHLTEVKTVKEKLLYYSNNSNT